jgi:hypothetical protein
MEIELYDNIKKGLQDHIKSLNLSKSYNPSVVGFEPSEPSYPLVIIDEVNNVPYQNMRNFRQTVSDKSYRVDIYAETKGSISKQEIARMLMKHCNDYLTCIGLKQVSMNTFANDGTNGKLYHIVLMYSARYFENKQYFV